MLRINEPHMTIGVQGWTKIDGKWKCIEKFTERKFGNYGITTLRSKLILRNPKVEFTKIYLKTPISVPFLQWYDKNGNETKHPLMDD